jgi:hypothetical protein
MLPLGRLDSRKRRRGAASCLACGGPEEDATHFACVHHVWCAACGVGSHVLAVELDSITSGAFGQLMFDEPLDTVLLGLLGDNYWGDNAAVVDSCVRSFLVAAWAARELAVVARGPATVCVVELEVDLAGLLVSMYLGLGVFGYLCPLAELLGLCWV